MPKINDRFDNWEEFTGHYDAHEKHKICFACHWDNFPVTCECGGNIHQGRYVGVLWDYSDDYCYKCDECGMEWDYEEAAELRIKARGYD